MTPDIAVADLLAWSLQIAAIIAAGGALPWLLRLDAPDLRHGYWRALLLACLLLPMVQPWRAAPAATVEVLAFEPSGIAPAVSGTAVPAPANASFLGLPLPTTRVLGALGVVLATGALLRIGWLVLGLIRLRRIRRTGVVPRTEPLDVELGTLAEAGAEVRYVPTLRQPMTFGAWRPIVLLPETLRQHPDAVRRAVLVHELWHVRRRDWLWVVVEEAVRAVFWFHPGIHWLVSRVQTSREEVVDELTVLTTNSRRAYIEALLLYADSPGVYPATAFARRRHLFQRVLLISKEAVMSSRRIVASCAAMGAVVVIGGWYGVGAFPLVAAPAATQAQSQPGQPRDLRPGEPRPASARETALQSAVAANPTLGGYLELAQLQEARGAVAAAETTLESAQAAMPNEAKVLMAQAGFYVRAGKFDRAMRAVEQAAALAPADPAGYFTAATFYEQKIRTGANLSDQDRASYIQAGLASTDRALSLSPDYVDAMIMKNILLRHQANLEATPAARAALIQEADTLRARALELQQRSRVMVGGSGGSAPATIDRGNGQMSPGPVPPPPPPGQADDRVAPPPPAPPDPSRMVDGMMPVRVGGAVKMPTKLVNVPPVYPEEAKAAGTQGVVIIEAVIDPSGAVRQARVLRSIPALDDAAVEAVKQWQFTPTLLNGVPVPVIMTVTVNFTLQ